MGSIALRSKGVSTMILLILSISAFGVIKTHGQCEFSAIKKEVTALGSTRQYCEHQIKDGTNVANLKVMQGASFDTLDCHTCTCNQYGMRCCPNNRDPRSIRVPPHCTVVMDGCTPIPVRKFDNKTDCYSAKPVQVAREDRQRINNVLQTFERMHRYQRQQAQKTGAEPPEGPTLNEIVLLLSMSGALDNPYAPVGSTGQSEPPFTPMNDMMMPLMMLGMMGS